MPCSREMTQPLSFPGAIRNGETTKKGSDVSMLCKIRYSYYCGQRKSWQIDIRLKKTIFFLNVALDQPAFQNWFFVLGIKDV